MHPPANDPFLASSFPSLPHANNTEGKDWNYVPRVREKNALFVFRYSFKLKKKKVVFLSGHGWNHEKVKVINNFISAAAKEKMWQINQAPTQSRG